MGKNNKALTETEIRSLLINALGSQRDRYSFHSQIPSDLLEGPPKKAAVLVPLLFNSEQWHILYTVRTATLPEHSGQVAFPGGRADSENEPPEFTALREAQEEINLKPQDVNILGRLNDIHTISNYIVTPVVGGIPPKYEFSLAQEEVSRIFTIPVNWLIDTNNHEIKMRELPVPYPSLPVIYFKTYDGELLWGVSAEITLTLLDTLQLI
jgi:8-oxo-dGTP pyrophosphatase MutT (NUDIX family)